MEKKRDKTKEDKNTKIRFFILILFILTLLIGVNLLGIGEYFELSQLRDWVLGYGSLAPLVYILFYAVAPTFMLPGLPLTVLAGILFGPFWGVIYVSVGANIGACIAFIFARYMGRAWIENYTSKEGTKLQTLYATVEKGGWKIVAFTRIVPLFPFNLLNYGLALTPVKFTHYALASFIFMLPGIIAYVTFSSSLLELTKGTVTNKFLIGFTLIIIIFLIPLIYKKYFAKS
ncbi:MAG: TVP38/TMEM64 family protein [Deltaproteobacteria bacterium]|nr:TVP38/TMEM64 family protein [Deltaproteobacteria bacterium]